MPKKRANGEGSIRKNSKGLWEGRYCAGRDADGKVIRKSVYAKTKTDCAKKLAAIHNELSQGTYIEPTKMTVAEWSDIWLNHRLPKATESTREQYHGNLVNHVLPQIGNIQMQKVNPLMIQNVLDKGTEDGLSAKSVRNLCGILHHMFQDAANDKIIKENPAINRKIPKVEKNHDKFIILEDDKRKEYLEEIKGKSYEEEFFIDVFTGMREGELLGLMWDCIDFDNNTIRIDKQLKRDRHRGGGVSYIIAPTKTGNIRTITVAPSVMAVLRSVRKKQMENKLRYGSEFQNPDNLVFTNDTGGRKVSVSMWKEFKKRVAAIGIPEMRFHDLRHTTASILFELGYDIKYVSEYLGHTNISTTADIYTHITKKMKKDAADKMESLIKNLVS